MHYVFPKSGWLLERLPLTHLFILTTVCKSFEAWIYSLAIKMACKYGKLHVVKELLRDRRVDAAAGRNYGLKWAIKGNHTAVVEELMKNADLIDLNDPELILLLLHAVKFTGRE